MIKAISPKSVYPLQNLPHGSESSPENHRMPTLEETLEENANFRRSQRKLRN